MRRWQTARTCKNRPSYGPSHSPRHSSRQKYAWSKVPIQLPWRAAWMQIEFQHGLHRRTSTWDEQGSKKHRDRINVTQVNMPMTCRMWVIWSRWPTACVCDMQAVSMMCQWQIRLVSEIDWNLTCKWNLSDMSMTEQDLYMKLTEILRMMCQWQTGFVYEINWNIANDVSMTDRI
jgi:hypothetical protein